LSIKTGYRIESYTEDVQPAICSMEFIYFARPDSNIAGVNVHTARKNMGRNLAQEAPVDADMVIGVPNSSLSAASGYAEESGIPYELGLGQKSVHCPHLYSTDSRVARTGGSDEAFRSPWRG
jgi:amidophosphoribosyltransferase